MKITAALPMLVAVIAGMLVGVLTYLEVPNGVAAVYGVGVGWIASWVGSRYRRDP
jgi:hypothetical protein